MQRTEHLYDTANRLTEQNWTVGPTGFAETYTYNAGDGSLHTMSVSTTLPCSTTPVPDYYTKTDCLTFGYDALKRLVSVQDVEGSATIYTRNYSYLDHPTDSTRTTSWLGTYTVTDPNNVILTGNRYEYDANGNITKIYEVFTSGNSTSERLLAQYSYDSLNQLATETRYTYSGTSTTPATTTTVTYVIDTAGNLRSVTGGEHSVSYAYDDSNWADKLTGITVDNVSRTISYADAGNPSNWYNGTHEFTNLTWTQGRRLSNITEGSDTYSYEYDMSGVRTVKIADGLKHEYVTQNGRVVRETVYAYDSGSGEYSTFQYALDFTYDESGHPLTMRRYVNAAQTSYYTYHYVLNAQGDVVKLLYGSNTTVAEYSYDAWGNILSSSGTVAALNPLRYRGYYFDQETGFYYLQSRYYDPIVKRFLNADSYGSTGQGFLGFNMFAYCNNDPVVNEDPTGHYIRQQPVLVCDNGSSHAPPPSLLEISGGDSELLAAIERGADDILSSSTGSAKINNITAAYQNDIYFEHPSTQDWVNSGIAFASSVVSLALLPEAMVAEITVKVAVGYAATAAGFAASTNSLFKNIYKAAFVSEGYHESVFISYYWSETHYETTDCCYGYTIHHITTVQFVLDGSEWTPYPPNTEDICVGIDSFFP